MLLHNYNNVAGTVQYWDTSDSQERYQQNLQNPKKHQKLKELGYINSVIEYKFNSQGFRCEEILEPDVLCFGCSFTMGTGLDEINTWPAQFSSITRLSTSNLGHAGSSNDTAVRFAMHYVPKIKPKFAIWVQTDTDRIEIIDEHVKIVDNVLMGSLPDTLYGKDYYMKIWATSEINQTINKEKNTLSFKQLCYENRVTPIVVPRHNVCTEDLARDLMHPGRASNRKLAEAIARLV
jgi:hypothetical protein